MAVKGTDGLRLSWCLRLAARATFTQGQRRSDGVASARRAIGRARAGCYRHLRRCDDGAFNAIEAQEACRFQQCHRSGVPGSSKVWQSPAAMPLDLQDSSIRSQAMRRHAARRAAPETVTHLDTQETASFNFGGQRRTKGRSDAKHLSSRRRLRGYPTKLTAGIPPRRSFHICA
jgi:hypothetical protein